MPTVGRLVGASSAKSPDASMMSFPAWSYGFASPKIHSSSSFCPSGMWVNGSNGFGPNSMPRVSPGLPEYQTPSCDVSP